MRVMFDVGYFTPNAGCMSDGCCTPESDRLLRCREMTQWAISDILRCRKATAAQVERLTRRHPPVDRLMLIACNGGISTKVWQRIARRARQRVAIRPPSR
jgi:hypothetical protein